MTPETAPVEKQPKRVSVVIVSLNRLSRLRQSLQMLGDTYQITVVDNGSFDGSAFAGDEFPGVRSMRLPKNFGSTKALNIGLRTAEAEYVLFLHDDARISSESVGQLADYLETHPDVWAVCPRLLDGSGNPAPQVRALPTTAVPDPPLQVPSFDKPEITAECVLGAVVLYRASFLRALPQIDERYGDYGPDIDLAAQLRRANRKIVILSEVTAVHEGLTSPVSKSLLEADRVAGTAVFLGKYHGFMSGLMYRITNALSGLSTFRFGVVSAAVSGQKIDGA